MAAHVKDQGDDSLEQSRAAWHNFSRLVKLVVAVSALTLIILAFATL